MTVSSQIARNDYQGNGVTSNFPVTFRFLEDTHLRVLRTVIATGVTTPLTLNAGGADGYTVAGAGQPSGGQVTTNAAPALGTRVSILRNVPVTQETDYIANDPFPAESHERALDKLTMVAQQLKEVSDRSIVLAPQTVNVSTELPGPQALYLLRWNGAGTGLENVEPPKIATVADGSIIDASVAAGAGIQSSKLSFLQSGINAVLRTVQSKERDIKSVKDNGAAGDGVANDGPAIVSSLADYKEVHFPSGAYLNNNSAVSVPFNSVMSMQAGATLSTTGTGTFASQGSIIWHGRNPDNATWTDFTNKKSRVAIFADLNGHGDTGFDNLAAHVGMLGAVNIPSGALTGGWGIAGYAKTVAPGGPAVGVYGEANLLAPNTVAWGINTRSQDNGFDAAQVWGAEIDLNIKNVGSTVVGVDVVGGSTVMPPVSIAYRVGPLGTFAAPKIPWARGFFVDDESALVALEIGAGLSTPNVGCPPIVFIYRDGANVRKTGATIAVDGGGALVLDQSGGTFIKIRGRSGGSQFDVVQVSGNALGFFGAAPTGKGNVTGSKGGNVALDSLLQELALKGIINNLST